VGELQDRRARKKARTRAEIRAVARRLFEARGFDAVTIADIAAEADVAVQTVFNHFATKEELFFDGRTPWVEGAAAAVQDRPAEIAPLRALREFLVESVRSLANAHSSVERRQYLETIQASPALRSRERELVHEAECRLTEALTETWSADADGMPVPGDPATSAAITAASWLSIARVLLVRQRDVLGENGAAAQAAAEQIASIADELFDRLESGLGGAAVTGWPADVRRAC